ncbi:hypothetical protein HanRHA438_Chr15g0705761 [Helianthus annuus]|uniref:Uncharacterized protein n=1 Tax=Helianthus annuus TaxID=4232 RepID=A0A9K3E078_HELAN|nr:uncharacterized protein LOC110911696 isoform X1 [Helianthus annuus]KAF5764557.1 hypothetical protein HanXRQr2_Chr15g0693471 [Helianthus annuus]KAJ0455662.1 hypothetical protein HanIR_Chr15g0753721 [Helianthus annuus]KAJ0831290.1 hypothetical protein HanPSC8_Chr15g0665391 [Helianthus annuus]KAJ0844731.1 hypothetical protein HanRHA438_Chr15g0705761 [Helianthus annuus]
MNKSHTHTYTQTMGMKGHPESNYGVVGGGGGWMKKKTTVATVVVLVALMGVMVVQKVKDRRLFNLVIKDKDRQIISLRLLLQKERQYAKENKKKNQDLAAKLYSFGTQKIELTNKIMEMRSTIGSLKDEQRVLELAIDEKQNQIKQKESEIKDLKSSLQPPPKIWSVSSDDPSNREVNLTNKVNVMNPDVKVQTPKDEKLAGSKDHKDDAKIEMHNTIDGQDDKSQLKANPDVGPTEVHHETNKTRSESERMDEDETETEADLDSSKNGTEADQDYKEETEE